MIPSFCQQRHRHHRNGWPRARAPEAALQLDLEQDHHVNPMRSSSNNKNSTPFNAQFDSVCSLLSIFVSESLSDFSADQAPPSPLPCGVYAWVPHSDPCRYDPNPGRDRRRRETLINNILRNAMMLQPDAAAAAATPAMASSRYALAILAIINVAVAGEQSLGNTAVPSAFREAPEFRNGVGCAAPAGGSGSASFSSSWSSSSWCGDASAVHIAMTLDAHYLRGSMAAVLSVLRHTGCPENVVFHLLMPQADFAALQAVVRATFPYLRFRAYPFQEARVRGLISESVREALENPLNYARSYLADMLPRCLRRVIYLDSDLIVLDDIARLWETRLAGRPIAAPEYCHANFSQYFTPAFWADERLARAAFRRGGAAGGRPRRRRPCYFNTGVMVIDLALWRRSGFTRRIEAWMGVQRRRRIYELGSLPPFLLVFAGQVRPVEHRWNQHGLGGDNVSGRCRPLHAGPVSLLHWSGKGKPWLRLDARRPCPMDALWAPYDLYQNHRYP